MSLSDVLSRKRDEILRCWFDEVLTTYPAETSLFLRRQKNPFTNPVGATIVEGLEGIFDELLGDANPEKGLPFLDNIIRIRAVQDFTPSQALSFIVHLKGAVRSVLPREEIDIAMSEELFAFETKIDELALLSFDIFMKCREKLYDLKANEMRKMTFRLLERVNRLGEAVPESESKENKHE